MEQEGARDKEGTSGLGADEQITGSHSSDQEQELHCALSEEGIELKDSG